MALLPRQDRQLLHLPLNPPIGPVRRAGVFTFCRTSSIPPVCSEAPAPTDAVHLSRAFPPARTSQPATGMVLRPPTRRAFASAGAGVRCVGLVSDLGRSARWLPLRRCFEKSME
jgi:hypothetical protein